MKQYIDKVFIKVQKENKERTEEEKKRLSKKRLENKMKKREQILNLLLKEKCCLWYMVDFISNL